MHLEYITPLIPRILIYNIHIYEHIKKYLITSRSHKIYNITN